MTANHTAKADRFKALHQGPRAFLIANAWDAGSARILSALGFQALATSSGASAGVLGKRDGQVTREEALTHARAIVEATELPVSADLEKGFGDSPAMAAETIRLAGGVGLVGGSIEDATGDRDKPLYEEKVSPQDLDLLTITSDIDEACEAIAQHHESREQELKEAASRAATKEAVQGAQAGSGR